MKQLKSAFSICLVLFATCTFAQTSSKKIALFDQYPNLIDCREDQLNSLFATQEGKSVRLVLPGGLKLEGKVIHNIKKDGTMHMIAIDLPQFNHILFSLSRRMDIYNKPIYRGHIINASFTDGYELKRNEKNNYQLTKVETAKILPYCGR